MISLPLQATDQVRLPAEESLARETTAETPRQRDVARSAEEALTEARELADASSIVIKVIGVFL
jgi:hypothetical protein